MILIKISYGYIRTQIMCTYNLYRIFVLFIIFIKVQWKTSCLNEQIAIMDTRSHAKKCAFIFQHTKKKEGNQQQSMTTCLYSLQC